MTLVEIIKPTDGFGVPTEAFLILRGTAATGQNDGGCHDNAFGRHKVLSGHSSACSLRDPVGRRR
jgi:hypothetical protein